MNLSCMKKVALKEIVSAIYVLPLEDFKIVIGHEKWYLVRRGRKEETPEMSLSGYVVQIIQGDDLRESFFTENKEEGLTGFKEATAILLDDLFQRSFLLKHVE